MLESRLEEPCIHLSGLAIKPHPGAVYMALPGHRSSGLSPWEEGTSQTINQLMIAQILCFECLGELKCLSTQMGIVGRNRATRGSR